MTLSWGARLYVAAVIAIGATVFIVCLRTSPIHPAHAILLAALFLLSELFPVMLPRGGAYSVSFVVALAALITQGPAGAVIAASAGTFNLRHITRHSAPIASRLFNGANYVICTGLAALTYRGLGGPIGRSLLTSPARALLPVVAATCVNFAANTVLVAVMLSLATPRRRFRPSPIWVWKTEFARLLPGYLAFALVGLLLGLLYEELNAVAMIFVLVPLLVARSAFAAAVRIQSAYEATVETLITAIDAKDHYTKDHAGRVARLTEMTAREYGLRGEDLRTIRLAALMHDVGKLGVPTALLVKPGKLTAEEYSAMKDHPVVGHELVKEIDMLRNAVSGVRHHHERMDGSGYPDGLSGEQIPLTARLIMTCDAYDSMTSTRSYRTAKSSEEALQELRRCAGSQFDPKAIDALDRALTKHGWTAEPEIEMVPRASANPSRRTAQGSSDALAL
ncbi:MAG: HD-GYP domain-containing protein [Actinomycetota bacterium]